MKPKSKMPTPQGATKQAAEFTADTRTQEYVRVLRGDVEEKLKAAGSAPGPL